MPLSDFASLLGDLANHFGEDVEWKGGHFPARFRIDPFTVPLPSNNADAGLVVTQTWLYGEIAVIPRSDDDMLPDLGDILVIREWQWEIVEVGDDDLGERQWRLLRREPAPPERWILWDRPVGTEWDVDTEGPTEWESGTDFGAPGSETPPPPYERVGSFDELAARAGADLPPIIGTPMRAPGRPSRRDEILAAYQAVQSRFPPDAPLTALYGAIWQHISGRTTPGKGLARDTLRKVLGPVHRRRRGVAGVQRVKSIKPRRK